MTEPMLKEFRASMLPYIVNQPALLAMSADARARGLAPPPHEDEKFAVGKAYHACMESACAVGRDAVDVDAIALRHGVDPAEVRTLWDGFTFDPHGFTAEHEVALERVMPSKRHDGVTYRIRIVGHLDAARMVGQESVEVYDWKSTWNVEGHDDADVHAQVLFYALGSARAQGVNRATAHLVFVRRGDFSAWSSATIAGAQRLQEYEDWFFEACRDAADQEALPIEARTCQVGSGCERCAGQAICPIFTAPLRQAAALARADRPLPLSRENFGQLYHIVKTLESLVDSGKKALKAYALAQPEDAPIPDGFGKEFRLYPKSRAAAIKEDTIRAAGARFGWSQAQVERFLETIQELRGRTAWREMRLVAASKEAEVVDGAAEVRDG